MIPEEKLALIRDLLKESKNPYIFYDDDADGVSSFLLCWHYCGGGHGHMVNMTPRVTKDHLRKIQEYNPDLVIILDLAEVDQEFIDGCTCKILWIDHHTPQERTNVEYINPLLWEPKDNKPVTYWTYKALGGPLWIATIGSVGDWLLPDFLGEFREKFPDIIEKEVDNPGDALYCTNFNELFNAYSFNFKGTASEAMRSVKILTRVSGPYDILKQKTKEGKFLWDRYQKINKEYVALLKTVKPIGEKLLVFKYKENKYAFTSDISNYLVAKNPDKFVIVGRDKGHEMICSLRAGDNYDALEILNNCLKEVKGTGGGHKKACGCKIKMNDFEKFIELVEKQL